MNERIITDVSLDIWTLTDLNFICDKFTLAFPLKLERDKYIINILLKLETNNPSEDGTLK